VWAMAHARTASGGAATGPRGPRRGSALKLCG
jgi:hypothetical protein